MALFFADLVREASWGTGTGDLPLGGALPGHRRFADAVPAGARFYYCVAGVTRPDEWENPTLDRFLEALSGYLTDLHGWCRNCAPDVDPEQAQWRLFAVALAGAAVYE